MNESLQLDKEYIASVSEPGTMTDTLTAAWSNESELLLFNGGPDNQSSLTQQEESRQWEMLSEDQYLLMAADLQDYLSYTPSFFGIGEYSEA